MIAYFRYLQMLGMRQMLVIPIEMVTYDGSTFTVDMMDTMDTLHPGLSISVMAYAPGITTFYTLDELIRGKGHNQTALIYTYDQEYKYWLRYVQ